VALNVLSALSSRELERAIALGDKAALGRAQEWPKACDADCDRIEGQGAVDDAARARGRSVEHSRDGRRAVRSRMRSAALLKLGYSQIQAAQAVAGAVREFGAASAETLIREACGRWDGL